MPTEEEKGQEEEAIPTDLPVVKQAARAILRGELAVLDDRLHRSPTTGAMAEWIVQYVAFAALATYRSMGLDDDVVESLHQTINDLVKEIAVQRVVPGPEGAS